MNVPLATFLRARFARLAPCCIASTVIVVGVMWGSGDRIDPADVVRTLLVLPLIAEPSRVHGAMWSLAVEGCLYLMFPLLLALVAALGPATRRLCLAICAAGFATLIWRTAYGYGFVVGPGALLRGLFPFVAGMLLYGEWCANKSLADVDRGSARSSATGNQRQRLSWPHSIRPFVGGLCRRLFPGVERRDACTSGCAAVKQSVLADLGKAEASVKDDGRNFKRPAIQDRAPLGTLTRLLDSRPIRWLGEISLPLYLCQVVPLRLFGQSLWAVPVTVGLAASVHYLIEKPGRRWLRAAQIQRGPALEAHHHNPVKN